MSTINLKPILPALLFALAILFDCKFAFCQSTVQNYGMPIIKDLSSKKALAIDSLSKLAFTASQTNRLIIQQQSIIRSAGNPARLPISQSVLKNKPKQVFNTRSLTGENNRINNIDRIDNTVCRVISGRNFLDQDSLVLYTGESSLTHDGNVIVSGEYVHYIPDIYGVHQEAQGGFCMKTDVYGKIIWSKLFDSTHTDPNLDFDYVNYFKSLVLADGRILLAGRTTNRVSHNDDFMLTMLDGNGGLLWTKTYESRYWQGYNGSGDYFVLRALEEDPVTGDIYLANDHWTGRTTITKVSSTDGHIYWSTGYDIYDDYSSEHCLGLFINADNLVMFRTDWGYSQETYINAFVLNKNNGDTLSIKRFKQLTNGANTAILQPLSFTRLNNGHYEMAATTFGYYEFPTYTGTKDLYHVAVVEFDTNLEPVNAWGFKNRVETNYYNTNVSLFPDGAGLFTMLDVTGSYDAEAHITVFNGDQIYHQRKRLHTNEGIPYEPRSLQMADGGMLNIKLMGESGRNGLDGAHIDFYRMHASDTASICIGVEDSATSVWHFGFQRSLYKPIDSVLRNVVHESRLKSNNMYDFYAQDLPACKITTECDSLHITTDNAIVCPGTPINVSIHKNAGCGSLVPLLYDTALAPLVRKMDDSTYQFTFNKPGNTRIYGSLLGCKLQSDSVSIRVLPALSLLNLGPDTVLCPGNKVKLNAHAGFATYTWQDGSTDSTFFVSAPGKFYVDVTNGCGTTFSDTVIVKDHAPIPLSIGPDRIKCNSDTVRLAATAGFIKYSWSSDYYISSLSGQQVVVNPPKDTIYWLTAEKEPGCFATTAVKITVNNSPKINLGNDTSLCANDQLVLNAGNGFTKYEWNTQESASQITITKPGTYFIKATTAEGCSSVDTFHLLGLYELPKPSLGADAPVCSGQEKLLSPNLSYSTYLWSTGSTSAKIFTSIPATYWVNVTDNHACKGSDTIVVTGIADLPAKFLGGDTTICTYGTIKLEAKANYSLYTWSSGSTTKAISINKPGNYWLEVVDNNNCRGRDTINVIQKDCMEGLYVPNAFSPNSDRNNDVFRPLLFGNIETYLFRIYNQWGQLVFETTVPGSSWDGRVKGRIQDTGGFVWTCVFQLRGKPIEKRTGTFVLIK